METNTQSYEDRIRFGSLISDLSARFISPESLDWEIDHALEQIVSHLRADRGGLAQFDMEKRSLFPTHTYVRAGAPPMIQVDFATEFPWYTAEIRAGHVKTFPHLPDGLPPEAEAERRYVRLRGMKSHVLLPLRADGATIGSFGIACYREYRDWSPEITLLELLATIFGHALARHRSDKILRNAYAQVQARNQDRTAEFLQIHQALQEFTLLASHDLQEPLRKIGLFSSRFMDEYGHSLDGNGLYYLKRIQDSSQRMQDMLTGLLDYSRASGKAEPCSTVNLTMVVREVIEDLEARIQETNGNIEVEELPIVKANPYQMRQLFQNLIGNALKFHGEESPLIKISSRTSEDHVLHRILVEDNGIGFEEKDADTIFMPFKRLHDRNSTYKGSGIGLSICQRIVERHGGTIIAKSTPGKGSTFIITLPARQD
jgi:signal transduction histidine kinase